MSARDLFWACNASITSCDVRERVCGVTRVVWLFDVSGFVIRGLLPVSTMNPRAATITRRIAVLRFFFESMCAQLRLIFVRAAMFSCLHAWS